MSRVSLLQSCQALSLEVLVRQAMSEVVRYKVVHRGTHDLVQRYFFALS